MFLLQSEGNQILDKIRPFAVRALHSLFANKSILKKFTSEGAIIPLFNLATRVRSPTGVSCIDSLHPEQVEEIYWDILQHQRQLVIQPQVHLLPNQQSTGGLFPSAFDIRTPFVEFSEANCRLMYQG